ncbi:lipase member J [Dermatophagoides farinae]|uniref:lipase member J n=1 Tax=Dermatophagoides farinae TaxID=6954 RepID=UPI003F6244C7
MMSFVHRWLCVMILMIIVVAINYMVESALPFSNEDDEKNPDSLMMMNATEMDVADVDRDIFQIILSRGFQYQQHFVTTEDGYILQLIRIVNPFINDRRQRNDNLKPIVLFHGFQCTGSFWLITMAGRLMNDGNYYEFDAEEDGHRQHFNDTEAVGVGNTIGFVLASRGFDVWVVNYRGSIYSNNHIKFNTKSRAYWSFSIDEMALIDLPAIIDYVTEKTNHTSIGYIGHSQGNFIMLALLSTRPEYSRRIRPYIALSPVFYTDQLKTPLRFYGPLKEVLRSHPTRVPFGMEIRKTYTEICMNPNTQNFCYNVYHYFLGGHRHNLNMRRMNVYLANVPMGSSSWNVAHFFQMFEHGQPSRFDYGALINLRKYGSLTPPIYDAGRINSTDMAFIYLANDYFNSLTNVDKLKSKLKVNLIDDYLVPDQSWGHMDLVWSKYSGRLVNQRILDILARYD